MANGCVPQDPKEPNADDLAMLLANMAKSKSISRVQTLHRKAVPALTSSEIALDQLVELFNKGANGGYNAAANYDYLGYVFADMIKVRRFHSSQNHEKRGSLTLQSNSPHLS